MRVLRGVLPFFAFYLWPAAFADIPNVPVPFTGRCYCAAECSGASAIDPSKGFERYRVDFNVEKRTALRDDEETAAQAECEKSAKERKFGSKLESGEKTPMEMLKQYCLTGGSVAPACTKGCAAIGCGASQYER